MFSVSQESSKAEVTMPAFMLDKVIGFSYLNGDTHHHAVTLHEVSDNQIQPGRFIDPSALIGKLNELTGMKAQALSLNDVVLDQKVIVSTDTFLVWHTESHQRSLWFRDSGITKIQAKLPSLIYVLNKKNMQLYVFAKATNSRPTQDTPIYHAPLCNIGSFGNVCQGSASIPSDTTGNAALMGATEKCLFDSNFTHVNNSHTFRIPKLHQVSSGDHIKHWKSLEKVNRKPLACDLHRAGTFKEVLTKTGVLA